MSTIQRCSNFLCPGVLCYLNCIGVLWLTVFSRTILLTNSMFHVSNQGQGLPWSTVDLLFISQSLALSFNILQMKESSCSLAHIFQRPGIFKTEFLYFFFFIINSVVAVNIEINSETITSKFIWPYCLESFC